MLRSFDRVRYSHSDAPPPPPRVLCKFVCTPLTRIKIDSLDIYVFITRRRTYRHFNETYLHMLHTDALFVKYTTPGAKRMLDTLTLECCGSVLCRGWHRTHTVRRLLKECEGIFRYPHWPAVKLICVPVAEVYLFRNLWMVGYIKILD